LQKQYDTRTPHFRKRSIHSIAPRCADLGISPVETRKRLELKFSAVFSLLKSRNAALNVEETNWRSEKMRTQIKAQALRIYIGEQDQYHGGLLYSEIVRKFREIGIAGVTVFHGIEGYGDHGKLHTSRIEVLFQGLPIVVEAIDRPERINFALATVEDMVNDAFVTVIDINAYRFHNEPLK
jgi:PII-like signaling protein